MGYTTDFFGEFTLDKPLSAAQVAYLSKFSDTRRMTRDATITATLPDPLRLAVGLPVGVDGGYYVGSTAMAGQDWTPSPGVLSNNAPPSGQPGLWCKWVPTEDGSGIKWNEMEKFYEYTEWLNYIIVHFLTPWGIKISGEVRFQGEDSDDRGVVRIVDGVAVRKCDQIIPA